jgi:glycosyltransferase involved in cell wall biosynthesis
MIIGIDASKAAKEKRTGVENYIYQLLLQLKKIDRKNTYFLFTNSPLPRELVGQNFIEKLTPAKRFWNKIFLPLAVLRQPIDVYIQPTDLIPWSAPKKSIAIIHDLAYKHFPDAYSTRQKVRQFQSLVNITKRASKIVCVSKSTENDLIRYFPRAKGRTKVIPLGFDTEIFHPFDKPRDLLKLDNYILCTGRIETRKNTHRLVAAFNFLKDKYNIPHKLVLAGSPGYNYKTILKEIKKSPFTKEIIQLGYVNDDRLPEIIARADLFAFPTLYEGFGLSVLEAMACGTPVVTSRISSLPEIVGDAALLCDPENEKDIAEKMYKFISDKRLKEKFAKLGVERSRNFSWESTAKTTLKLVEEM